MLVLKCALPKDKNKDISKMMTLAGIPLCEDVDQSRNYIISLPGIEFILAKPQDVPIIVEYGAADIGIVGSDILLEENRDVIALLDLKTNLAFNVSDNLIVNRASYVINKDQIDSLLTKISSIITHTTS